MTVIDGRFRVLAHLAHRTTTTLYLAHDQQLDRRVHLELLNDELADSSHARELFHREARALCALRHPNIVDVYEYSGKDVVAPYLVMQAIDGVTIRELLGAPIAPSVTLAIIHEVAIALSYMAERELVHRDVSPSAVCIDHNGWVLLTDFGIARGVYTSNLSGTLVADLGTRSIGNPAYTAPEVLKHEPASPAADVYSLATIGHQLLTGTTQRDPELTGQDRCADAMAIIKPGLADTPDARPSAAELAVSCEAQLVRWGVRVIPQAIARGMIGLGIEQTAIHSPGDTDMLALPSPDEPTVIAEGNRTAPATPSLRISRTTLILTSIAALVIVGGALGLTRLLSDNRPGLRLPPSQTTPTPLAILITSTTPPDTTAPDATSDAPLPSPLPAPTTPPRRRARIPVTFVVKPWAVLFIDDKTIGATPLPAPILLERGIHELRLINPSYPVHRQTLRVGGNRPRTVRIDLTAPSQTIVNP